MVIIVTAVTVIALSGGAAAPAVAAAGSAATSAAGGTGVAGVVATYAAGAAATGAVGAGAAGAAATGAVGAGVAATGAVGAGAGAGAVALEITVAGIVSTGTVSGSVALVASGPLGWGALLLGAEKAETPSDTTSDPSANRTFDCWKPVLHDESPTPSSGMLLKDVFADKRIKQVTCTGESNLCAEGIELPGLVFENIWDEQFRIDYLYLPNGQLAAHAVRI